MSGSEEYLADIGRAADELNIGLLRVEVGEVEILVGRAKALYRVVIRPESYGKVDGNALRSVIAPQSVEPKK